MPRGPHNPALEHGGENSPYLVTGGGGGGGEPTGPAGGDLAGSEYPNPIIAALAVTAGKLAAGAVTAAKLAGEAVGTAAIAALAVTTEKIAAAAVTAAKIAAGAVTNEKLAVMVWVAPESVNAEVETVAEYHGIQCALFAGQVYLRGNFKVKVELAIGSVLFTLPPGLRPETTKRAIACGSSTGSNNTNLRVNPNGTVENIVAAKVAVPISLEGANFPVAG